MGKIVEFKIDISNFDPEAWKRLVEARKAVADIEADILKAYAKSDRAKAAYDLAGFGDVTHTKYNPITRIETSRISTSVNMDIDDGKATASPRPTLFLAEKTVNMLLSGKLLNDDQKKALLKQVGLDVDALETPTA